MAVDFGCAGDGEGREIETTAVVVHTDAQAMERAVVTGDGFGEGKDGAIVVEVPAVLGVEVDGAA